MEITHLTIKNFKGIDEQGVRINFAPITLLFGPNNAGKSTVIQALLLAREVLCHGNPDPDRVEGGGESIRLGGFKEFVHKHDLTRAVTIGVGIEIDYGNEEFLNRFSNWAMVIMEREALFQSDKDTGESLVAPWVALNDYVNKKGSVEKIFERIYNIEVQFTISWRENWEKPFVSEYAIYINEVKLASFIPRGLDLAPFSGLNFSGLLTAEEKENMRKYIRAWIDSKPNEKTFQYDFMESDPSDEEVVRECLDMYGEPRWEAMNETQKSEVRQWARNKLSIKYLLGKYQLPMNNIFDAMTELYDLIDFKRTYETLVPGSSDQLGIPKYDPLLGPPLNPDMMNIPELIEQVKGNQYSAIPDWHNELNYSNIATRMYLSAYFLSALMIWPGLCLRKFFFENMLQYIGPLRQIPPRNFKITRRDSMATKNVDWPIWDHGAKTTIDIPEPWNNGLAAWDLLANADEDQLEIVNKYLNGEDYLQTGYTVCQKKFITLCAEPQAFLEFLRKAIFDGSKEDAFSRLKVILAQQQEVRIFLHNEKLGIDVSPNDIGAGISQIIPVIVASALATTNVLIAIEQPELHVHPAGQTVLGDIFLKAIDPSDKCPPMFLLETHSEHLMLRLLRRIRETFEDTLPEGFHPVTPKTISVLYVQAKEGGGTKITPLPITLEGDFACKWPNGFFSEREEELFG